MGMAGNKWLKTELTLTDSRLSNTFYRFDSKLFRNHYTGLS